MTTNLPAPTSRQLLQLSDLWKTEGSVGRGKYALWGSSLFGIKYGIDTCISEFIFHQHWDFVRYLFPGQTLDMLLLSPPERWFYGTILVLSLPFIWVGVVLTIKRLRSCGLPVFLVYLFFVPFVNLLMFVILSVAPSLKLHPQPSTSPQTTSDATPPVIPPLPNWPKPDRSLPKQQQLVVQRAEQKRVDMIQAMVTTVLPAIGIAWLSIFHLQSYGWGLFIGVPFAVGMSAAYIYGKNEVRTFGECVVAAMVATTLLGLAMFFFAWEGMVCLLMASPIVYTLAFMGAVLGYHIQKNRLRAQDQILISVALLLAMPTLIGAEFSANAEPPLIGVKSFVEIPAPPAVVWRNVVAFPKLEPPSDWLFHLGIAYPIGATINGAGAGAVRKCNFSTGAFIEPIKVWDEPRLLKFGVQAQPPSMREFSWMHEIHPAHLKGYLQVHGGQFQLEPMTDSRGTVTGTRLIGTTWYQNKMWPNQYWRIWSDEIMHRIHMRVLNHIRTQSLLTASAQPTSLLTSARSTIDQAREKTTQSSR